MLRHHATSYELETLRLLNVQPLHKPKTFLKTEHDRFLSLNWRLVAIDWSSLLLNLSRLVTLMQSQKMMPSSEFRAKISLLLNFLQGGHGGYGKPAENLLDTYSAKIIIDCLGIKESTGILKFTELCSDEVFGFRLIPSGSANSLAIIYVGLRLFDLCHATVMPQERIDVIRRYIASCQTNSGGFGRTPSAIATLADTWLALDSLQHLIKW